MTKRQTVKNSGIVSVKLYLHIDSMTYKDFTASFDLCVLFSNNKLSTFHATHLNAKRFIFKLYI
jgi:hypothetical protein